jgi:hypothetical protein
MLQDTQTIRYYQRLTDSLVDLWNRGYRFDDLRMYIDGYLAALRQSNSLEPYLIHRLEEEITRYLYDPSNMPNQLPEPDYRVCHSLFWAFVEIVSLKPKILAKR